MLNKYSKFKYIYIYIWFDTTSKNKKKFILNFLTKGQHMPCPCLALTSIMRREKPLTFILGKVADKFLNTLLVQGVLEVCSSRCNLLRCHFTVIIPGIKNDKNELT